MVTSHAVAVAGSAHELRMRSVEGSLRPLTEPDEIARFITPLARPESTYINGARLTIDGGFSA